MHCRNYMEQYSRTKSIHELNKSRNSYKLLTQHSKLLNSNAHLKLSQKKAPDQYHSNQSYQKTSACKDKQKEPCSYQRQYLKQPLHASTKPNTEYSNIIKSSSYLREIHSKAKMKTSVGERSIKSISEYERALQKMPKNSIHIKKHSLKNIHPSKLPNRSISTNEMSKSKPILQNVPDSADSKEGKTDLDKLYDRMKSVLSEQRMREEEWEEERRGYKNKIKNLEDQLHIRIKKKAGNGGLAGSELMTPIFSPKKY